MNLDEIDRMHMRRALELAENGRGTVEPNPMVGCVIARRAEVVGEGWHRRFGEEHAEIEALKIAGPRAEGATMYVTLEPCCHQGKTPPCTKAIVKAGIARVVIAMRDPFPRVSGGGIRELEEAGITLDIGIAEDESRRLNAPYLKLVEKGRPWCIAKWAMTLDGKTATETGSSKWISNEESRRIVHELRGRVDAIVVGGETARRDDPLLTVRPPGKRVPLRVVFDSRARLSSKSRLVQTAGEVPVLVVTGPAAPEVDRARLQAAGCEVLRCDPEESSTRVEILLDELGKRRFTNILIEGGGRLAGTFFATGEINEIHAFIAPKLVSGVGAPIPLTGLGILNMEDAIILGDVQCRFVSGDVYVSGVVHGSETAMDIHTKREKNRP